MTYPKDINAPLGKKVSYTSHYDASLLCPIPREQSRNAAGISSSTAQWCGEDIWNLYELSWLSPSGRPEVAIAEVRIPCDSPFLIESKSMKLYCNSLNMTSFDSIVAVGQTMKKDLGKAAQADVSVQMIRAENFATLNLDEPTGISLDDQDITDFSYKINPALITHGEEHIHERLFSRLFRSCCPVTGQPDWATIRISYEGKVISRSNLLRYLVSYREHTGFHEACVEKIFLDILEYCTPAKLKVSARFTRRGGIDINPVRSTHTGHWENVREARQ